MGLAMTIAPEIVERFRDAAGWIDDGAEPVGVAVSGGPDSLALLILAQSAWLDRVVAVTVDHGLRPESAAEARYVGEVCAQRGIVHAILRPATPISGSLQAEARRARYALIEQWRADVGACCVMTAHHADDQAETLLMRLNRGAGVSGLAGIRAVNGRIIRPLLGWRRAELEAIVAAEGVTAIRDPSNEDMRFDRARFRRHLADAPWIDPMALAKSAANIADAEAALGWMVETLAPDRIAADGDALTLDPAGLPAELLRRLVVRAVRALDPACNPSGPELDRALAGIAQGGQISIGGLLARGGPIWRFSPAPPRRTGG